MKKLTFWGSVASIIGLIIAFISLQANSEVTSTTGNKSPAINNTTGDININYGASTAPTSKKYVLRESQGGLPTVLKSPHTKGLLDPSEKVCSPIFNGTKIKLLSEKTSQSGYEIWQKIEVLEGECIGKVGWVLSPDINYE